MRIGDHSFSVAHSAKILACDEHSLEPVSNNNPKVGARDALVGAARSDETDEKCTVDLTMTKHHFRGSVRSKGSI